MAVVKLEKTYSLINETLFSDAFKQKHRLTKNSFTRTRTLPFATLVTYFLNLTKGSYQQELDNFFAVLNPDHPPSRVVTKSASLRHEKIYRIPLLLILIIKSLRRIMITALM